MVRKSKNSKNSEKDNSQISDTLKKGIEVISDGASTYLKHRAKKVSENIEKRIIRLEENVLNKIAAVIFIIVGIVMLGFSLFYFFKEYINLNNTVSFAIFGLLLILISIAFSKSKKGG